jgi:glutamate decarboxylase
LRSPSTSRDKSVKRYNEFDVSNKVREKGWILSAYSMPPDAQEINSLRNVVRPHMNRDVSEILSNDIERGLRVSRTATGDSDATKAS